jgi:O-antigen/teichoic acid export membrane protein
VTVGPAPRRLASGAFVALSAQVAALAATTVTSVAIARLLGPSGTGAVALVINLIGLGTMMFGFGLRSGIIYELNSGTWPLRRAVRQTALTAVALGTAGGCVVLALYALTRDSVFENLSALTAAAAAAALPFAIAIIYAGGIALARERYEAYAVLQVLPTVATLVLAVSLAIPFEVPGAAVGIAAATAITALFGWVWLSRYAKVVDRTSGPDSGGHLRRAARFGVQAWGGDVLQFLNYRVDLFILNSFAVIADVGVYSVAVTLTSLAWVLPNALTTVLFPRAASLEAATRSGAIEQSEADLTAVRGARQTIILLVPSAIVPLLLLFVAVPLLYGDKFAESTRLGLILLPGVLVIGLGKALSAVTTGRGHPRYALFLSLISFPFTVVLYALLIPPWGATGAATASTFSYVLTTIVAWIFYRRVTGLPFRTLIPGRQDVREAWDSAVVLLRTGRAALGR